MKAISIRQPWADHILDGEKDVENRSWQHSYRGWVVLHASATVARGHSRHDFHGRVGAYVGAFFIEDIVRDHLSTWAIDDHHHWVIGDTFRLDSPIIGKGKLGLFAPPDEVHRLISMALFDLGKLPTTNDGGSDG